MIISLELIVLRQYFQAAQFRFDAKVTLAYKRNETQTSFTASTLQISAPLARSPKPTYATATSGLHLLPSFIRPFL